jgi:hypothetical protein
MQKNCPICNNPLEPSYKDQEFFFTDRRCATSKSISEHFYIERLLNSTNEIVKMKLRIDNTFLKINYDTKTTQMWEIDKEIVSVDGIFEPDFSDIDKLKRKIKTLLTFS